MRDNATGLRALRHRDYRLYFAGQLVSQCGTWMQSVGQSWLVLQLTDSALKLGLVTSLQWLPTLLFCLVAGAVVDRLPKRRLLLVTQATQMLVAFALFALVATGTIQYWQVAVAAFCLGLANAFDMPARQAFIVEMVGKEDLGNAIVLNSAMMNGARLLGPALAGVVVAWKGVGLAFLFNGVSFLAVLGALLAMEAQGLPRLRQRTPLVRDVVEGLRYALRNPAIAMLLALMLVVGLFVFNFNVTIPLLATRLLRLDAKGYGALMSAIGAGALCAGLTLGLTNRKKPELSAVVAASVVFSGLYFAVGAVRTLPLALGLLVLLGISQIHFSSQLNTALQMAVSDEMRGRVMSMYTLAFAGTTPLGSLIMGSVTEAWGAAAGFFVGGGLSIVGVVLLTVWWVLSGQPHPARRPLAVMEPFSHPVGERERRPEQSQR
ncbi:MAG: MFS transporter [Betaproteobacteria bacterium]